MSKDKALTGAAGEYYVAFQLSARGYAVGLTARGTKSADLLVTNLETGKSVTIQVKTMWNAFVRSRKWEPYWKWRVGTSRAPAYRTFFYAFVDLKENPAGAPDVFIVPSVQLEIKHKDKDKDMVGEWLDKSGRVVDAWCNIEEKDAEKYKDRWNVIEKVLT